MNEFEELKAIWFKTVFDTLSEYGKTMEQLKLNVNSLEGNVSKIQETITKLEQFSQTFSTEQHKLTEDINKVSYVVFGIDGSEGLNNLVTVLRDKGLKLEGGFSYFWKIVIVLSGLLGLIASIGSLLP